MDSPNDDIRDVTTPAPGQSRLPRRTAPELREGTPRPPPGDGRATRTKWVQLGVVSAASFVAWTAFGAILPYLPLFLKEQAHSSMAMIGVIAAMYYVGTLLFSSPLGWLSDTIGRKPVIVGGAALGGVAMLLFTTTANPYWFILFRLLEGIGTAGVGPAGQAFVADITPERDRSKAYGILTTAQFGGLIIGPALAPPLYHLAGGGQAGFYAIFYFGADPGLHHDPPPVGLRQGAGLDGRAPGGARGSRPEEGRAAPVSRRAHAPGPGLRRHRLHEPLRDGRLGGGLEHLARAPRRLDDVHRPDVGRVQRARCCSRSPAACSPTATAASR